MEYEFHEKGPDRAYVSNMLWLPKKHVRVGWVKAALEFIVPGRSGPSKLRLWHETSRHIVVPREFIPPHRYKDYGFEFVDLRPTFQKVGFEDLVVPRDDEQTAAWAALRANSNGILNLACGKGKTKLALKKIAQAGVPTLVVVPDGGILDQWKRAILGDTTPGKEQGPGLRFDGPLGIVQGKRFDEDCAVTLALVTSLWQRIEKGTVPEGFRRRVGLVVYDEVHQIGAPKFSLTAPEWYGDRIGLTATVVRDDGLDSVYLHHIGRPFYSDLSQDLVPGIEFQLAPTVLDHKKAVVNGIVNASLLRGMLGVDALANTHRYWKIKGLVEQGRKVLCLSHSLAQLRGLHAAFPGSGLIIGDTARETRLDVLRGTNPCFAISRLGSTGVDDDSLDTLVWLTPFSSPNILQQSMGRIQRRREGKKKPLFVVMEDWCVGPARGMCQGIRLLLRRGKFQFWKSQPQKLPPMPAAVREAYDAGIAGEDPGAVAED